MATKLNEVLRGCRAGRVQSVGLMQVIPLLAESDNRFSKPSALVVKTSNYGTLVFENKETSMQIVPRDSGYLTKSGSQDHGMPTTRILESERNLTYDGAACIEESQGGYIEGDANIIILPFPLREASLVTRDVNSYNKLWKYIGAFNKAMGLPSGGGHINIFLREYEKQLARFVAEFEPVPGQVGAIVIIGGRIVGVERTPSHEYWLDIWEPMIRECYGSLVLYFERNMKDTLPRLRKPLAEDIISLNDLATDLRDVEELELVETSNVVNALMEEEFTTEVDEERAGFTIETLMSTQFVGQTIREELNVVYASITATKDQVHRDPITTELFQMTP